MDASVNRLFVFCFAIVMLIGCRTATQQKTTDITQQRESTEEQSSLKLVTAEREEFGGTLRGVFPLSPRLGKPQAFQIEADGITLEVILTDTSMTYEAKAIPVARSKLRSEERFDQSKNENKSSSKVVAKEKQVRSFRMPWWVYLIIAVLLLIGIRKVKERIKQPFKGLLNGTRK